jgi:hypothetical protein
MYLEMYWMICSLGSFNFGAIIASAVDGGGWELPLTATGDVFFAGIENCAL